MASIHEINLIAMSKGFKPDVQYFVRDSFGDEEFVQQVSYPIDQNLIKEAKILAEYGKNPKNHFIEIRKIQPGLVVSKFYPEYDPLLIIYEASFYTAAATKRIQKTYQKLLGDSKKLRDFVQKLTEAYKNLKAQTGFGSDDISANNVLIKPDLSDFKIIDTLSLHKDFNATWNPQKFFFTNKFPKHDKDQVLIECLGGKSGIQKVENAIRNLESVPI